MSKHYYEMLLDLPVHLLEESYDIIQMADKAHNEEHIRAVVRMADMFLTRYPQACAKSVITAAMMHDLGCMRSEWRAEHEVHSARIAQSMLGQYEWFDMDLVLTCIVEHRASFKGELSCLESKLVSAADRGLPKTESVYYRAYLFATDKSGLPHEEALVATMEHIIEKFGEDGYASYSSNELLMSVFEDEVKSFNTDVREMTVEKLEGIVASFSM